MVLGPEREKRRDEALDLPRVESGLRRVVEIKLGKPRTRRTPLLLSQRIANQNPTGERERKHVHVYNATHHSILCSVQRFLTRLLHFCAPSRRVRFLPQTLNLSLHASHSTALTISRVRQAHTDSCRASREPGLSPQSPGPVMRERPQSGPCIHRHQKAARSPFL